MSLEDVEFSVRKNGYLHRAPETIIEGGCHSYASDLFSLGCSLYYITFNQYPYKELDAGDPFEYAKAVIQ